MAEQKVLNVVLTKRDSDLAAWLNMLKREGLSPRTWIQAILLADAVGEPIDAGGVCTKKQPAHPPLRPSRHQHETILFGDDSEEDGQEGGGPPLSTEAFHFQPGQTVVITISRPVIQGLIQDLEDRGKLLSPYVKAVLRKHIRQLKSGPDEPPGTEHIEDLFVLHEERFVKAPTTRTHKSSRKKRNPSEREDTGPKKKTSHIVPAEQQPPSNPQTSPRKKNPLLDYID